MDKRLILVFAVVIASIGGALAWRITRTSPVAKQRPRDVVANSLVVLLRNRPQIDKATIESRLETEFGREFRVTGELPHLSLIAEGRDLFLRVNHGEFVLAGYPGPSTEYDGWIEVEDNTWSGPKLQDDPYPIIGRVLAALWTESAVALLHPMSLRQTGVNAETARTLRRLESVDQLFSSGDVELTMRLGFNEIAALEARREWPEFVEAFRARDGERFRIITLASKARIGSSLWFDVIRVRSDGAECRSSDGSRFSVALSEILDWRYERNGEVMGQYSKRAAEARK